MVMVMRAVDFGQCTDVCYGTADLVFRPDGRRGFGDVAGCAIVRHA